MKKKSKDLQSLIVLSFEGCIKAAAQWQSGHLQITGSGVGSPNGSKCSGSRPSFSLPCLSFIDAHQCCKYVRKCSLGV